MVIKSTWLNYKAYTLVNKSNSSAFPSTQKTQPTLNEKKEFKCKRISKKFDKSNYSIKTTLFKKLKCSHQKTFLKTEFSCKRRGYILYRHCSYPTEFQKWIFFSNLILKDRI